MSKQITAYTLAEMKEQHPEGYAAILKRWQDGCAKSNYAPWLYEISLKATVKAFGGTLKNYRVNPYSNNFMNVEVNDDYSKPSEVGEGGTNDGTFIKDQQWAYDNVLASLGYARKADGKVDFPGLCPFTGYCADEGFIEAVWKSLGEGETLTEALEGLADIAGKMMEANWEGCWFAEDGTEVPVPEDEGEQIEIVVKSPIGDNEPLKVCQMLLDLDACNNQQDHLTAFDAKYGITNRDRYTQIHRKAQNAVARATA